MTDWRSLSNPARSRPPLPPFLFHGSAADPLDILLHGIQHREDRPGVSLTITPERAKFWAALKTGDVVVYRLASSALQGVSIERENAWPAEPDKDFTALTPAISPAVLSIQRRRRWVPLLEAYEALLDDEELETWHKRWGSR